ncbi:shikimate dehydrogenase [Candidatus Gottesmanbacteria bacterium RBG_16_37_8]|uniref:Shikimate dehydrogenase (NADP(+)) n=1 Tax=Candidatus Gottesmanbacteria bacterium RBG_16_37_8 TaxID=1798371 RepID=A0A1F5YU76_9BACT|nr:MAG: shikimate dehydrogenase [Candidatus Gottesmanbacteria bacterium RBG_16_37_8]
MLINAKTLLCCIIGKPVNHSLSPQMHNAAFKSLNLNYVFLAFNVTNLKKAIEGLKAINCRGIVVTIPHKVKVIKFLDGLDTASENIGAVNVIKNLNGKLIGGNSDWIGAIQSLKEKTSLKNKKVAVLGAGGAARAIIYGLKKEQAEIHLFNRSVNKAEKLASDFQLKNIYPLSAKKDISNCQIIINATSVGMEPDDNSPVPERFLHKDQFVFDIVYTPHQTRLLKFAQNKEAIPIFGYKMVLYAGLEIFKLFTKKNPPLKVMEEALLTNLHS